jgi:hypothetical protein
MSRVFILGAGASGFAGNRTHVRSLGSFLALPFPSAHGA